MNDKNNEIFDHTGDSLDYSNEEPITNIVSEPRAAGVYDPRPQEDTARRVIAFSLIGLLWIIIGAMLILVAIGSIAVQDMKEFNFALVPIVTLVSAATGFYYGTKYSANG